MTLCLNPGHSIISLPLYRSHCINVIAIVMLLFWKWDIILLFGHFLKDISLTLFVQYYVTMVKDNYSNLCFVIWCHLWSFYFLTFCFLLCFCLMMTGDYLHDTQRNPLPSTHRKHDNTPSCFTRAVFPSETKMASLPRQLNYFFFCPFSFSLSSSSLAGDFSLMLYSELTDSLSTSRGGKLKFSSFWLTTVVL